MAEVFKYVDREQLRHSRIRCHSPASKKRRHAEDDSVEHRRLRIVDIDTGASTENPGSIAVADHDTPETDIASGSVRAETTEHRSSHQGSHGSSNRAVNAQVSHRNNAYTNTLDGQEQHCEGSQ